MGEGPAVWMWSENDAEKKEERVVTRALVGHTADVMTDTYSRPEAALSRAALRLVVGG